MTVWRAIWLVIKGGLQLILMAAVLFGSYLAMERLVDQKAPPRKRPAFKTIHTVDSLKVAKSDHQPSFISYGQVVAARIVDLRSLVSGQAVAVSKNLRVGGRVEQGEPLVEIDDFNFLGGLREAEANLAEAKARVEESKARIATEKAKLTSMVEQLQFGEKDLERARALRERGTLTEQQVESRNLVVSQRRQNVITSRNTIKVEEARLNQQEAALKRLNWRVEQAKRNLENTVLKAPFTGVVRSQAVEIGRMLSANDVVVSLYQENAFEVRFTLTDAQFGRLQNGNEEVVGRSARVIWTVGGQEIRYDAEIDRIGAEINSSRGGVEVFARITKGGPRSLRPGAFVELLVADSKFENMASIPETSLYEGKHVFKIVEGSLKKTPVTVAGYDDDKVIISKGLATGDEILVTRLSEAGDGLAVRSEAAANAPRASDRPAGRGAQGRPSKEFIAKVLRSEKLTLAQWRAKPIEERRKIIQRHRTAQNN